MTKPQLRVFLHNPFKNEFARANIYPLSGSEHISGPYTRKEIASLRFLKRFQQLNPHLDQSRVRAQQEALPGSPPFMLHLMLQSSQGWVKYLLRSFFFFPSKEIKNKKLQKKKN